MDIDITKSDWYLVTMVFLSGCRLILELHTLRKQMKHGNTNGNLDTSSVAKILTKLEEYVSELLARIKKKY